MRQQVGGRVVVRHQPAKELGRFSERFNGYGYTYSVPGQGEHGGVWAPRAPAPCQQQHAD